MHSEIQLGNAQSIQLFLILFLQMLFSEKIFLKEDNFPMGKNLGWAVVPPPHARQTPMMVVAAASTASSLLSSVNAYDIFTL